MSFFEKRPMVMIALGVIGISLSSIFVKFSAAPPAAVLDRYSVNGCFLTFLPG